MSEIQKALRWALGYIEYMDCQPREDDDEDDRIMFARARALTASAPASAPEPVELRERIARMALAGECCPDPQVACPLGCPGWKPADVQRAAAALRAELPLPSREERERERVLDLLQQGNDENWTYTQMVDAILAALRAELPLPSREEPR